MCGAVPSFHQYAFMAWCSVRKKEQAKYEDTTHSHTKYSDKLKNITITCPR